MTHTTPPDADQLAAALGVYAAWFGGGDPARAGQWVDRLASNAPELERLRDAPLVDEPAYLAIPTVPQAPAGHRSSNQCPSGPDAATALQKARALDQWNLTTALVGTLPAATNGYLNGMPIAVKDLIGVAGLPRTGGSASEPLTAFSRDADCVAALRRHGGVIIGLANLHELAFGANSANLTFGSVVNPAASDRIPGGSSGGSAALVAAGVVPATLGSDTGGSIRIPSACCGVVGFKPSHGVVSTEGVMKVGDSLDAVGPIGRTVVDCAYVYAALTSLAQYPGLSARSLHGLRVARLTGHFEEPLDGEVAAALDGACAMLGADGLVVATVHPEGAEMAPAIYFVTVLAEAGCQHAERIHHRADQVGEDVRLRLEMGMLLPAHWYVKAQKLRRRLVNQLDRLFDHADVLICATMRAPAPRIGQATVEISGIRYPLHAAMADLTLPFSLAGLPALSLPWGRSQDGVPIGLQLVAARGQDWQLLDAAYRLEQLRDR